jgi:diguanylate cyclase (GGDEF)-like protein
MEYAEQVLERHPASHPDSWLVVPVESDRHEYGRLLAMHHADQRFFPVERELLHVYARYAASALDGARALMEAQQRYDQSAALLDLARALARAGTSNEVALRLAEAVPAVVDCDRVGVFLWDPVRAQLIQQAVYRNEGSGGDELEELKARTPAPGGPLERLLNNPAPEPMFIDAENGDPMLRELSAKVGAKATIIVPLATTDSLLGLLVVSVTERPERLKPGPELLDRLSGVAAQATTALQNGALVDQITHQALHDQLTGLANRLQFTEQLRGAINQARQRNQALTLFYLDLDGFKPVNDEFGHEVGDQLLVAVGQRLLRTTRDDDTVARLGGDEFALLVHGHTSPQEAEAVIARLTRAFHDPFKIGGHQLQLGASVGRAVFPIDADSADDLLRCADSAMFQNKRGRSLIRRALSA